MSKIQDLKGTHNAALASSIALSLFLMSKIQDLKGTHNAVPLHELNAHVVSDVKDTRFERNSQHGNSYDVAYFSCF